MSTTQTPQNGASGTGCEMSEAELLEMLRGINSAKIKSETRDELDKKHGIEAPSEPTVSVSELSECTSVDAFLDKNPEVADFNQYWYSKPSIERMVLEIREATPKPYKIAFVSTPSLFFSLPTQEREHCAVLDFDKKWDGIPGFVFYDFNEPTAVPAEHHHAYDMLVIDPPFITREVWEKYTITAKLLLAKNGRILCSTIDENEAMMQELLQVHRNEFRPLIPNLVYQYSLYTNFDATHLSDINPEIGY